MFFPPALLKFIPSGTSSNETLHTEINSWTRTVNAMHRSTLALKLRYFRYLKLLAHHMTTMHPLGRQVDEAVVVARAEQQSIWTEATWGQWCVEQKGRKRQLKASPPLTRSAQHEREVVRRWVQKKPAGRLRRTAKNVKRTPLKVLFRKHSLGTAGVKHVR